MMLSSVQTVQRSKCGDHRSPGGFSLVEVTVAVGICAFVILALVGLMATGLTAGREASKDTATAAMADTVLNSLRTNSYATLRSGSFAPYWFTQEGVWLTNQTGQSADTIYKCDVTVTNAQSLLIPEALRPGNMSDLGLRVRLSFSRPLETNQPPIVFETVIPKF